MIDRNGLKRFLWMTGIICVGLFASSSRADTAWTDLAEAATAARSSVVEGRDGWLFLPAELRHLGAGEFWGERAREVSRATRPDRADPTPAILDFHRQLAAADIHLLLVPVPPKALIYADKLSVAAEAVESAQATAQTFYDQLRSEGVDVLDMTGLFMDARSDDGAKGWLYCRQDTHWTSRAAALTAHAVVDHIGSRVDWGDWPALEINEREQQINLRGDLWLQLEEPRPPAESLTVHKVLANDAPIPADRQSPVLVLGDSHTLVFHAGGDMHGVGAGLVDHLAGRWQRPMDVLGVRGSGATPARINLMRRARGDADYLAGKQVVIWCFAAREFTQAEGWMPVPLR